MRITFELEPDDIARFNEALARAHRMVQTMDECDIVAGAKQALDQLPIAGAPAYVRRQLVGVQRLIVMLEDEAWSLPRHEREDVLETLIYFSDPEDLIPDDLAVIGLLDDAIMLELVLRRQRHVLQAYTDFCAQREAGGQALDAPARIAEAGRLARLRERLQARMRRRAERSTQETAPPAPQQS